MASKKITISLSEKNLENLEALVSEKGLKKSAIISLALDEYVKKQKGDTYGEQ